MRDAAADFVAIVRRNRARFRNGVVHSFTGSADEAKQLLDLDLYIGINGCSLKTADNLKVVQQLPITRLMVESDAPWCEVRPSHASFPLLLTPLPVAKSKEKHSFDHPVKGRNEPMSCTQVLEVIAALHSISFRDLADTIYDNTRAVFS
jgi:TatD DNase family protein